MSGVHVAARADWMEIMRWGLGTEDLATEVAENQGAGSNEFLLVFDADKYAGKPQNSDRYIIISPYYFGLLNRQVIDAEAGGAEGIRTPDPHNAIVVLYQLSYDPSQMEGEL